MDNVSTLRVGFTFTPKGQWPRPELAAKDLDLEYESEATIQAVAQAIQSCGYQVVLLGDGPEALRRLLDEPFDVVFNIAEGKAGSWRESTMASLLEMLGIPYTHSDPRALLVTHDKALAKDIVRLAGLRTPDWWVLDEDQSCMQLTRDRFPLVVKPVHEGSSVGMSSKSICQTQEELENRVEWLLKEYAQPVLIESYLPGREFTITVIGEGQKASSLGCVELLGQNPQEASIQSYDEKVAPVGAKNYRRCGPEANQAVELAVACHRALGARDVSRVDVREDEFGRPQFIELNALPALNPQGSLLPKTLESSGMTMPKLVNYLIQEALRRKTHEG